MCHVVLLLPLLALPVFWIMPLTPAIAAYGVVLVLSVAIYFYVVKAMRRPVLTGTKAMIGETAQFVACGDAEFLVQVRNEIWSAACASSLHEGDRVKIVAVNGLTLRVEKLDTGAIK